MLRLLKNFFLRENVSEMLFNHFGFVDTTFITYYKVSNEDFASLTDNSAKGPDVSSSSSSASLLFHSNN